MTSAQTKSGRGFQQSSPVQLTQENVSFQEAMKKILFIQEFIIGKEEDSRTDVEQDGQDFLVTTHGGRHVYFIAESIAAGGFKNLSSQKFNLWITAGLADLLKSEE